MDRVLFIIKAFGKYYTLDTAYIFYILNAKHRVYLGRYISKRQYHQTVMKNNVKKDKDTV